MGFGRSKENEPMRAKIITRHDVLKWTCVGSMSALVGGVDRSAASEEKRQGSAKARIVVVGGGMGGIVALVRLRKAVPEAKIVFVAPNETHLYQPGQVFVAAGVYDMKKPIFDVKRERCFRMESSGFGKKFGCSILKETGWLQRRGKRSITISWLWRRGFDTIMNGSTV